MIIKQIVYTAFWRHFPTDNKNLKQKYKKKKKRNSHVNKMNKHFRDDCLYVYEGGCMRTSEPEKVKGQLLLLCEYTYVTRQRAGELIRYLRKIIQIALCKTKKKKKK